MRLALHRYGWIAALAACVLGAGLLSLALGQDANWDLRNYHWYNAYALLNGRLGFDLAPAQIQTYYNPLADLPFYALVHLLPDARAVAFANAAWAGLGGFFLLRILAALFPPGTPDRVLSILIAALIGLTAASGIALVGSTMNEWLCAALLLAALQCALRTLGADAGLRGFALAGMLTGCAVGLKLTYGVYGLGLFAAVACAGKGRARWLGCLAAGTGLLLGFLATYGYWGTILQREFGNPFFPHFNELFKSPWWEARNFFDTKGPRNVLQALLFPFWFARESGLVSEVAFRDYRLATLLALAGALALQWGWRRTAALPGPADSVEPWTFLAVFTVVSYVLWEALFSIHRYLLPLEAISGALIVAAATRLIVHAGARRLAIVCLALLLVGTTRKPGWERIPFGRSYFEVRAPELPPDALVIIDYNIPASYAIPFFRPDARFVSPVSNFIGPEQRNLLSRAIADTIAGHGGPLFFLERRASGGAPTPLRFGLERASDCAVVRSNLDGDALRLCALRRAAR